MTLEGQLRNARPALDRAIDEAAARAPAAAVSPRPTPAPRSKVRAAAAAFVATAVIAVAVGFALLRGGSDSGTGAGVTTATTTTATSTATTAPLVEAHTGAAAGRKVSWLGVLVGPDGRELKITYENQCVAPRGARAIMSSTRVVVTIYAASPSPGSLLECPPFTDTQALTLPTPVDGRFVVDGALNPRSNPYVPWDHPELRAGGSTVRVQFLDRTCSRVSRASVVETTASVIVTVLQAPMTTPTTSCRYGIEPLFQEVQLASPLGKRRLLDGSCIASPGDPACLKPAP